METQTFRARHLSRSGILLLLLLLFFLFSLAFLNPWVRGDGVGYYAYARALLVEHSLDFTRDYQHANSSFRDARLDEYGQPRSLFRTSTGHLENHFSVGPAILWAPFLLLAHAGILLARIFGSSVPADGFSFPYILAMAFGTALYAFLGLLLSYFLSRKYVKGRWAFLATVAIWAASALPLYMYFNPSWSHAHSAFAVALFVWYWHETRTSRSLGQWLVLALIAGLMLNVYYANATVLVILAVEAVPQCRSSFRRDSATSSESPALPRLVASYFLFACVLFLCLLPTFITRYIIYGNPFESGYVPLRDWLWSSPAFFSVLFSANHGLLLWTPVLLFSILGLFLFCRHKPRVGAPLLSAFLAFYILIACYPDWAGISSYGNRFFVSLTSLFILGLAVFLDRFARFFHSDKRALAIYSASLALFILWNVGLMFQWGAHLISPRGPVSFSEVAHNQIFVVPRQLSIGLKSYLFRRKAFMQQIEQRDIQQLENTSPDK